MTVACQGSDCCERHVRFQKLLSDTRDLCWSNLLVRRVSQLGAESPFQLAPREAGRFSNVIHVHSLAGVFADESTGAGDFSIFDRHNLRRQPTARHRGKRWRAESHSETLRGFSASAFSLHALLTECRKSLTRCRILFSTCSTKKAQCGFANDSCIWSHAAFYSPNLRWPSSRRPSP